MFKPVNNTVQAGQLNHVEACQQHCLSWPAQPCWSLSTTLFKLASSPCWSVSNRQKQAVRFYVCTTGNDCESIHPYIIINYRRNSWIFSLAAITYNKTAHTKPSFLSSNVLRLLSSLKTWQECLRTFFSIPQLTSRILYRCSRPPKQNENTAFKRFKVAG